MCVLTPAELEKQLSLAVQSLREALSPIAIYFFGSYAYGTPRPHSDIDLLVIVDESPLDAFSRDALAYRALRDLDVPKDVQVYTRSEFESRASLPISFERTVKTKGKLLYAA